MLVANGLSSSPLQRARQHVLEAESVEANGEKEKAASHLEHASELFCLAALQTSSLEMRKSLELLAVTHKKKANELRLYMLTIRDGIVEKDAGVRI